MLQRVRTRSAARDDWRGRIGFLCSSVYLVCVVYSGCAAPSLYHANIQSENPGDRILAIHAAGEAKDPQAVPLLVDRLEDEDDGVRFYAIQALERITGQRLGYSYADPPTKRGQAVDAWRDFVRHRRHARGADAGGGGDGWGGPTDQAWKQRE